MLIGGFQNLPDEKRERIINAALAVFGRNGYKKASIADIATTAGVSKAMIFYWFGRKRDLYASLVDLCSQTMFHEVTSNLSSEEKDFFEIVRKGTEIKMSILRRSPAMLMFFKSIYFEKDTDVRDIIESLRHVSKNMTANFILDGIDVTKFKETVDTELIYRFIYWAAEGFTGETSDALTDEMDAFVELFFRCMDMLKCHLYKEEYLN